MSTFSSLANRRFRWYVASSLVSYANLWALRIAQTWLILDLTDGDAVALGVTTAAQFFPILLVGLLGGELADRFHKVRVLAACDVTVGVLALVNAALALSGHLAAWHVMATAFLMGTAAALGQPARQAIPAEIVDPEHMVSAMGLASSMWGVGRIVGPFQTAWLLSAFGMGVVLSFAGVAMTAFAIAILRLIAIDHTAPSTSPEQDIWSGVRYLAGRRDLTVILVVMVVVCAMGWNSQLTIALVADEVLGGSAADFARLTAAFAVGGVLGTLYMARSAVPTLRSFALQVVGFCLLTSLTGLAHSELAFALMMLPLGFSALQVAVAANVVFVAAVPAAIRGRVAAVFLIVTNGSVAIGGPVIGFIGEHGGAAATYLWSGVTMLATVGLAAFVVLVARPLRSQPWLAAPVDERGGVASATLRSREEG